MMNSRFPFYKIKHQSPRHHLYDNWKSLNQTEICDLIREKVKEKIEIRFVNDDPINCVGRVNFNYSSVDIIPNFVQFNEKYKHQWYKFQVLHEIGHLLHYYSNDRKIGNLISNCTSSVNIKLKTYLEKVAILNALNISKKDKDIHSLFGTVFATFDFLRLVDYDKPNEPIIKPISPEHFKASNQILKMKKFKKICKELNSEFLKEEIIPI